MKTRKLTCIVCPRGCDLTVSLANDGSIIDIMGQTCPRGKVYAENECTNPQRTLTTTVASEGGGVIPVKTSTTIPKSVIFDAMTEISKITAPKDAKIGDILVKNFMETEADLVVAGKK